MIRTARSLTVSLASIALVLVPGPRAGAAVTREQVEQAIRDGVRFLKHQQRDDGSWTDVDNEAQTGTTSLVTLALLTAGEPVRLADDHQGARVPARTSGPTSLNSTYAIALQTMVFAAAEPDTRPAARSPPTSTGSSRPRSSPATASSGPARGPTRRSRTGTATTRTRSTPCSACNAASEVGVPVKPRGLDPGAALLGADTSTATAAGPTRPMPPRRPPPA